MKANIIDSVMIMTVIMTIFSTCNSYANNKKNINVPKRDPFVALVNRDGTLRSVEDLFKPDEAVPIEIKLKGILWGKKQPVAIINDKIFKEGSEITKGVILEKIDVNSVIVNYQGRKITTYLRKKEEK